MKFSEKFKILSEISNHYLVSVKGLNVIHECLFHYEKYLKEFNDEKNMDQSQMKEFNDEKKSQKRNKRLTFGYTCFDDDDECGDEYDDEHSNRSKQNSMNFNISQEEHSFIYCAQIIPYFAYCPQVHDLLRKEDDNYAISPLFLIRLKRIPSSYLHLSQQQSLPQNDILLQHDMENSDSTFHATLSDSSLLHIHPLEGKHTCNEDFIYLKFEYPHYSTTMALLDCEILKWQQSKSSFEFWDCMYEHLRNSFLSKHGNSSKMSTKKNNNTSFTPVASRFENAQLVLRTLSFDPKFKIAGETFQTFHEKDRTFFFHSKFFERLSGRRNNPYLVLFDDETDKKCKQVKSFFHLPEYLLTFRMSYNLKHGPYFISSKLAQQVMPKIGNFNEGSTPPSLFRIVCNNKLGYLLTSNDQEGKYVSLQEHFPHSNFESHSYHYPIHILDYSRASDKDAKATVNLLHMMNGF